MKLYDPPYLHPELGYVPFWHRRGNWTNVTIGKAGWSPRARGEYRRKKANGLWIEADHDCSYAPDVAGLRFVRFDPEARGGLSDDSPFFALSRLNLLDLNYPSKRPLSSSVHDLAVDELIIGRRPGIEVLQNHPTIRSLTVKVGSQVRDLGWLGMMPNLEEVSITGSGQDLDIGQLLTQPSLRSIELGDVCISDLNWVSDLKAELLCLDLAYAAASKGYFDLSPLGALREVRIGPPVLSLEPLRQPKGRPLKKLVAKELAEGGPPSDGQERGDSPGEGEAARYVQIVPPDDASDEFELYLDVDVPGAEGVVAAGHEPSGYFWGSLLEYLVSAKAEQAKATGLRNLPCRAAAENPAWLEVVLTAVDLITWTKTIAFADVPDLARCEIGAFRYRVLHVAARLARTGRQTRLRIDKTWRWAAHIAEGFTRLRAAFT